jgi:hypothetical protein
MKGKFTTREMIVSTIVNQRDYDEIVIIVGRRPSWASGEVYKQVSNEIGISQDSATYAISTLVAQGRLFRNHKGRRK